MENNKQTAVQEMIDVVQMEMNNGVEISMRVFMGMLQKAKKMEKQQIIDASGAGWSDGVLYSNGEIWNYQSPEHYYEEKYGGNK